MGNEFTGFEDNAPTLTLEPDLGESKAEVAAEPEAEAVKKEMEQTVLSREEQQMVDSFAKKIDIDITGDCHHWNRVHISRCNACNDIGCSRS